MTDMQPCEIVDLGQLDFQAAYDVQMDTHNARWAGEIPDRILLVEHPPVITLGRNYSESNLRLSREQYKARGIDIVTTDRGGDVTFHGPGQIVAYPIFDLREYRKDLGWYLRKLEDVGLKLLEHYGIEGNRKEGLTGVWINGQKVMAIGIGVRRWITYHGIAVNVNCDLSHFHSIVPCGISDKGVVSLHSVTEDSIDFQAAKDELVRAFAEVFDLSIESYRIHAHPPTR